MEERKITITLEKAREWYNSGNESLKEAALQAFNKDELGDNFKNITTFKDACEALGLTCENITNIANIIAVFSKASAAMFKLNIVRRALNLKYDLSLTEDQKGTCFYYPHNPLTTKSSTYFRDELELDDIEIIGKIKSKGISYNVFGGDIDFGSSSGLGHFNSDSGMGYANPGVGFLGCASKEIAEHFSRFFGMLITEAKYADMVDFEIIEDKYNNTK